MSVEVFSPLGWTKGQASFDFYQFKRLAGQSSCSWPWDAVYLRKIQVMLAYSVRNILEGEFVLNF